MPQGSSSYYSQYTNKSAENVNRVPSTAAESVATVAAAALYSAVYEGLQQPITGVTQIADQLFNSNLAEKTKFISAPKVESFGSVKWHAEQIGGAVGQLLPFLLSSKLIKPFFKESSAVEELGLLSKTAPIGLSIKEAAATGFVSQVLFNPTDNNANFWQQRLTNGSNGAITLTAITASTFGLNKLAESSVARSYKALGVLKNPVANGIVSGAAAGLLSSELMSVESNHQLASASEIGHSVYSSMFVGGALGAFAHHRAQALEGKVESRLALQPASITLPELKIHHPALSHPIAMPERLETPGPIAIPERMATLALTSAPEHIATPEPIANHAQIQINEQLSLPFDLFLKSDGQLNTAGTSNTSIEPTHATESLEATLSKPAPEESKQTEFSFPEPLTFAGKKAWKLLRQLEDMPKSENIELGTREYAVSREEIQAMLILRDEWVDGARRLYLKLADRSDLTWEMVSQGWNLQSATDVKEAFPQLVERSLIFTSEANSYKHRDVFVGIGTHYEKLGIKTPEEAKAFIELFLRTKPVNPWLWSTMDADPSTLAKLAKWPAVDQIPDNALRGITEHLYRTQQNPSNLAHEAATLIAAAPGWNVAPDLPVDLATHIGKLSPHEKVAAQLAFELTRVDFNFTGLTAHQKFTGEYAEAARAAYAKHFDQSIGLSTRLLVKKLRDDFGTPNAVEALYGDRLTPEQQREVTIALNMFNSSPQLLATVDIPTFFEAFDKLVEKSPPESDYAAGKYFGWQNRTAMVLTSVFKKNWQNWLQIQERAGRDPSAATDFLYAQEPASVKGLGQFLLQYGKKAPDQLGSIAGGWGEIENSDEGDYQKVLNKALRAKYEQVSHEKFAEEASRWNVPKTDYAGMEKRYLASLDVPSPFPLDRTFTSGNLTGRFIPRNDPRGLFLGEYSNCCQHPGGNAESSAWYGQENPKSGFFVVENQDHQVVAQSWAIATDDGGMMFDNVEAKGIDKRQQAVSEIYSKAAQSLLSQFHTVTMGTENSDLDVSGYKPAGAKSLTMPNDFSGYTDSKSQVLLAASAHLTPKPVPFSAVRGATNLDKPTLAQIAQERYPDGWQHLPWERQTRGLVVQSPEGKIMGYALYEPENHYVSDLAVRSKAGNSYALTLTSNLLKELTKVGGDWTADLRTSTSYKLVQTASRFGRVHIVSDKLEDDLMGDEQMHHVTFSVP